MFSEHVFALDLVKKQDSPNIDVVSSTPERKYGSGESKLIECTLHSEKERDEPTGGEICFGSSRFLTLRYVQSGPVHDVRHACNAKMVQSRANLRPRLPSYTFILMITPAS